MSNVRRMLAALVLVSAAVNVSAASSPGAVLIDAVRAGDAVAVASLLKNGADANAATPDGTTALHWAAHRDDVQLVDRLLRSGAKVNAKNRYGVTPISLAAVNANSAVLKRLLEAGADPNAKVGVETVLITAARAGNGDAIRPLVDRGADVNATTGEDSGVTALMIAAASNNTAAITALVERGANVAARTTNPAMDNGTKGITLGNSSDVVLDQFRRKRADDEGLRPRKFTAFLFAARAGHIGAMTALLKAGASVNETLADGMSALVLAVTSNKLDAASFLLDRGADPNAAASGWTALHQLAFTRKPNQGHNQVGPVSRDRMDSLEFAKKLVARGADVNARMTKSMSSIYTGRTGFNYPGSTPFMLAAHRVDVDYMRTLLEAGADPLLANDDNTTPLMAAAGCGIWAPGENPGTGEEADEAVKFILSLGADPNTVDAYGETALHGAAFRGATGAVEALAAAGARLDAKNMLAKRRRPGTSPSVGWTALMIAEGVFQNGGYKQQPETAAALRRLMKDRGLPTEYELPGRPDAQNASGDPAQ